LKYVCDVVVEKYTFAISSPDEFLFVAVAVEEYEEMSKKELLSVVARLEKV